MMPLDSEAIDINQLQQIMRLTGTPPASLISRMPSHEVRHVPSAFPRGPHLPAGLRAPASTHSTVYKPILLDLMLFYEVFIIIYRVISLHSQSICSLSALWLTAFVSARLPRMLCQCILMSFCMLTHWFWKLHNDCNVCNLGRNQIFKHALPEGCTVIKLCQKILCLKLWHNSVLPLCSFKIFLHFLLFCSSSQARNYINSLPCMPKRNFADVFIGANPLGKFQFHTHTMADASRGSMSPSRGIIKSQLGRSVQFIHKLVKISKYVHLNGFLLNRLH